jgi:hypothetical protein
VIYLYITQISANSIAGTRVSVIAYISTVIGNFPEKNCRQCNFDEFYPFLSTSSQKILKIYPKKLLNMVALKFTPPIFGKTEGDPAKWL